MNRREWITALAAAAAAPLFPAPVADVVIDKTTGISIRFIKEWKPSSEVLIVSGGTGYIYK